MKRLLLTLSLMLSVIAGAFAQETAPITFSYAYDFGSKGWYTAVLKDMGRLHNLGGTKHYLDVQGVLAVGEDGGQAAAGFAVSRRIPVASNMSLTLGLWGKVEGGRPAAAGLVIGGEIRL